MILSAAALLGSGRAWDLFGARVIADVHGAPALSHDPHRTPTMKGYPWVFDQRMPGGAQVYSGVPRIGTARDTIEYRGFLGVLRALNRP
jgi:hypothetical protein